jgi:dihydroceramidase
MKIWNDLSLQAKVFVIFSFGVVGIFGWISFEEWSGRAFHMNQTNDHTGFWGEITSSIEFCEDNYGSSYYIAEVFNTFSSLFLSLSGFIAYKYHIYTFGKASLSFRILYFNILLLGIGSMLFHMTLTRSTQLLDEIPMLYSIVSYLFIITSRNQRGSNANRVVFHLGLVVILTFFEVSLPNHPEFLQLSFLSILLYVLYCAFNLVSSGNSNLKANAERGLGISLLAAIIWISEPVLCQSLGWLQLHAWWHFFASLSCFFLMRLLQDACAVKKYHLID